MHQLAPRVVLATALALSWAACNRPVVFQTGPTPCVTNEDCASGGSCAIDADCPSGTTCSFDGACVVSCDTSTHMCLRGLSCASTTDCPVGAMCADGHCVTDGPQGCRGDADCPEGQGCDVAAGTCK